MRSGRQTRWRRAFCRGDGAASRRAHRRFRAQSRLGRAPAADQNIEFPRSDIEGALTFWASQLSAAIRRALCAWARRGGSSREKSLRGLRISSAFTMSNAVAYSSTASRYSAGGLSVVK